MNYGKSPLKDLGQGVRDAESYAIGAYDKGKKILSDDVNTKSNRKWLIIGLASTVALLALAFGVALNY